MQDKLSPKNKIPSVCLHDSLDLEQNLYSTRRRLLERLPYFFGMPALLSSVYLSCWLLHCCMLPPSQKFSRHLPCQKCSPISFQLILTISIPYTNCRLVFVDVIINVNTPFFFCGNFMLQQIFKPVSDSHPNFFPSNFSES